MNLRINETIKICHILTNLDTGGMENGVVNLSNRLDRNKFSTTIICLNKFGELSNKLKKDVNIYSLNEPLHRSIFRIFRVALMLKKLNPDIVHCHAWGGGAFYGILGAKLAGIKIIINGEHGSFFTSPLQLFFQKILSFLCVEQLSVSEQLKYKINSILKIPLNKIKVIKNGVDCEVFNGNYEKNIIIEKLISQGFVINSDDFNIFVIGSLKVEKNPVYIYKIFIDLYKKYRSINNGLKLVFVGSGPLLLRLKQMAIDDNVVDSVIFIGNRNDVAELLVLANVVVSASVAEHEGMSNIMLESMASGVPVVATKSVGASEIILNGVNGYLVDYGDKNQMFDRLEELYLNKSLCSSISLKAKSDMHYNFSIERMVNEYEKLYIHCSNKLFNN